MPIPKTPLLTVDCVVVDGDRRVLFIKRGRPPFQGAYALPGGFVDIGETVEDACRRELLEETGVKLRALKLIGVYSAPDRDPRSHTVSVAYLARAVSAKAVASAVAGDDASAVEWVAKWRDVDLAFDHRQIVADAFKLMRAQQQK
jgi:8-oxo-dGTP diphosphatase